MDYQKNNSKSAAELKIAVSLARKQILDLLELAFGDHPKWPAARTCVLRALGQSGLEGAITAIEGHVVKVGGKRG